MLKGEIGFAGYLEGLRETAGLNNIDIANFAGVSASMVSRWRKGHSVPDPKPNFCCRTFIASLCGCMSYTRATKPATGCMHAIRSLKVSEPWTSSSEAALKT
jgi:hypothetical protein